MLRRAAPLLLACLAGLAACRDASTGGSQVLVVVPNPNGANGCSGPDQAFAPPQAPVAVALATLVIGPSSQMTASAGGEVLYATGAGATVVMLDVSVDPPAEVEIVSPGAVADLLDDAGIAAAPELSGIAVLDQDFLVVVEHTSNTLIAVERMPPNELAFYAGQPNEVPGFADGLAQGRSFLARFSFSTPTQVCPTGDVPPRVFVADPGNHAVRLVAPDEGGTLVVTTVAGLGTPGYSLDPMATEVMDLGEALFDAPTGLTATCSGVLLVSERGGHGFGNRLRQLEIGQPSVFGGFLGTVTVLAGDGIEVSTEGTRGAARVARPVSPLATEEGEVYWIDSGTGALRRMRLDGQVDCPLTADCAIASFQGGHSFCLTQTPSGVLYVLDATDSVLWRVTP